jgi:hypothetical protein
VHESQMETSNAQTDICQMRGHGALEEGVLVKGFEILGFAFFLTLAFYETCPGHSKASRMWVGTASFDKNG